MNSTSLYFVTDNNDSNSIIHTLRELGLNVLQCSLPELSAVISDQAQIQLIVVDLAKEPIEATVEVLSSRQNLHKINTLFVLESALISKAVDVCAKLEHVEIIEKPYNQREFVLLVEKIIVVEKYRDLMKQLSSEYEKRIENYETLFHIKKSNLLKDEDQEVSFKRILKFEKNLIKKQSELNKRLEEFSYFRQKDMVDTKNILFAKDMLDQLREKELYDANETIHAQERVIEFSSHELDDQRRMIEAQDKVVELSRDEAIRLHHTIQNLQKEKQYLYEENQKLKQDLKKLKGDS